MRSLAFISYTANDTYWSRFYKCTSCSHSRLVPLTGLVGQHVRDHYKTAHAERAA